MERAPRSTFGVLGIVQGQTRIIQTQASSKTLKYTIKQSMEHKYSRNALVAVEYVLQECSGKCKLKDISFRIHARVQSDRDHVP
jgi:ABC-type bacteriocin/lantibiotic exporter with double-glycine peptidase domain